MLGTWDNALGAPFLHLSDIIARLSIKVTVVPPLPSALELGGKVCLGGKAACIGGKSTRMVTGLVYGGISVADPTRNYLMAMISECTMDKMFSILADTVSKNFEKFRTMLPSTMRQSGLYPTRDGCTGAQINDPGANPDCFARFSVSPSNVQSIRTSKTTIYVPQGFAVSARWVGVGRGGGLRV